MGSDASNWKKSHELASGSQGTQMPALLRALRTNLKAQGLRQTDIAQTFDVGVATVRRWLYGQGLSIQHFEALCGLANITLSELIEASAAAAPGLQTRLTPSQEKALSQEPQLLYVLFSLLHGWMPEDSMEDLQISSEKLHSNLSRLERLNLIDISPTGRVRLRTIPSVTWRRDGPIARFLRDMVKELISEADYTSAEIFYLADGAKLTPSAQQRVRELMEQLRRDFHEIAAADRRSPNPDRRWQGLFLMLRPLPLHFPDKLGGN